MNTPFLTITAKTTWRCLAAAVLFSAFTTGSARAQEPVYCTNATMNGTYVVAAAGTVFTPSGPLPISVVGKVSYFGDGTGRVTFSTSSVGGATSRLSAPQPGTFTVNADCTGTKILGGTHYDFVISPNGRVINFIVSDPGITLAGTGTRLDNRD